MEGNPLARCFNPVVVVVADVVVVVVVDVVVVVVVDDVVDVVVSVVVVGSNGARGLNIELVL